MRGPRVTVLTIVLVTGILISANAQTSPSSSAAASKDESAFDLMIGPRGSLGLPVGSYPITGRTWAYLKDDVKAGFAFGLQADKMVSTHIGVGAQVEYNINDIRTGRWEQQQRPGYDAHPDFSWKTLQFSGHVRYHLWPQETLTLFAQAGVGVYVNKFSTNYVLYGTGGTSQEIKLNETKTKLGINAGPGLLVRVGPSTHLTLDAIYHNVFTSVQTLHYLNITAGILFSITPG